MELIATPDYNRPGTFMVRARKGGRIIRRERYTQAQVDSFDFEKEWRKK